MSAAAAALRYWERRQEIAANNLANVNTDGFKGERVFARLLNGQFPAADSATDMRTGTLRPTGQPLDLALEGDGFFVVDTPAGERLSRGGSFRLDGEGRIVDAGGNALLGENGPLTATGGDIAVAADGRVTAGGAEVGRLRVETVPAGTRLQHDAGTYFLPDPARTPAAPEALKVKQGMLEDSNVSAVGEMVDMIEVQRAYTAVQRAITTMDDVRGTATRELGKPV
jgi:flagellar basal-body rod protein FlgF